MKKEFTVIANSQAEYWSREFNAKVILKDASFDSQVKSLVAKGEVPVIQIDNNSAEILFLKTLPSKSIVGWLYSDESFDLSFAKEISQIPSLILILRPYHLNSVKIRNLIYSGLYLFSNSRNVGSVRNFLKFNLWFIRGIFMSCRERRIIHLFRRANLKFVNFPLGYTDVFCYSYLNLATSKKNQHGGSLLKLKALQNYNPTSHLVFVGQVGQIVRRVAINAARNSSSSIVLTRDGYGAGDIKGLNVMSNGIEYVKLLLGSKFILCPPGNISGNSFRIHESVIVRRTPIVLSHVVSDPNFVSPVDFFPPNKNFHSWNQAISSSKLISKESYDEQVEANLHCLQEEIDQAKSLILKYTKLAKSIGFIN